MCLPRAACGETVPTWRMASTLTWTEDVPTSIPAGRTGSWDITNAMKVNHNAPFTH